jgi:hypothetical protein
MSLGAPDDFAGIEIGFPDDKSAGVGDDLKSLLEGNGTGGTGGYFMHGKMPGPRANRFPLS